MVTNLQKRAAKKARELHRGTNHLYDGKDYFDTHIERGVAYGKKYIHLIPVPEREEVICALYLHDTVEDCRVTFGDIERWFGKIVADIVYAVSNEKGKTRKDRANAKYYKGIRKTRFATFIKIADRLANVSYSKEVGSTMFKKYKEEAVNFEKSLKGTNTFVGRMVYEFKDFFGLHETDYSTMFEELNKMCETAPEGYKVLYFEQ